MACLLIYNGKNDSAHALLLEAARYIMYQGGEIAGSPEGYSIDQLYSTDMRIPGSCREALVFGGDGTLLAAVRRLSAYGIAVCGVNMGRVGFLSSIEREELYTGIDRLLSGDYDVKSRMMIHCQVERNGQIVAEYDAFNDFVIRSGELSRAISYSLDIDGQHVNDYLADGVIISTPSGSTAYSFSAGGPILMNDLQLLLITPVCAQPLFSRSIIAAADSRAVVVCTGERDKPSLTADGQSCFSLQYHDRLLLSAAENSASIICIWKENYFERIKQKLYRKL